MELNTSIAKPIVCARHWPKHLDRHPYSVFLPYLMESLLRQDKRYIERAIDLHSLELAQQEFYPLCCHMTDHVMNILYDKAARFINTPTPER